LKVFFKGYNFSCELPNGRMLGSRIICKGIRGSRVQGAWMVD
jgi:hypothetical protein